MADPVVSCVVPLFNQAQWVEEAVYSLARQDYRPAVIVVVNDGSTDGGERVVASLLTDLQTWQEPDRQVFQGVLRGVSVPLLLLSYVRPRGPAFARNRGMEAVREKTDFFALLDADDVYLDGKIRKSVARFLTDPAIAVVYSDFETERTSDGLRQRQWKPAFSAELLARDCILNSDSLLRRTAVEATAGFCEQLRTCEDLDMWFRLTERFAASHLAEALVRIRVGRHSSTDCVPKARWEENYRLVQQRREERRRAG